MTVGTSKWFPHKKFSLIAGIAALGALTIPNATANSERTPGWGIDACLSCHIDREKVPSYLNLLKTSDIVWLRERGLGKRVDKNEADTTWMVDPWDTRVRHVWRELKKNGFRVVAFAGFLERIAKEQSGNHLPEDLRQVYAESYRLGKQTLGEVDAFEMVGEPDAHYCKDLPDRVAAYQKAVYLGIKDGARAGLTKSSLETTSLQKIAYHQPSNPLDPRLPIVLSGGLAFPPGNWLDLAAANGIYEFTDAVNFHHYGFADDLAAAIHAHREFGSKWSGRGKLPVWITEAGLNNIGPNAWHNPASREAQARYIAECAEAALQNDVVVFMPFILAHKGDPFSMTESADRVFPAWNTYRDFTRENQIDPSLPLVSPPVNVSRVVMQWMPDNTSCIPFKVGGTYWFPGKEAIRGTLWVYNFSNQTTDITIRREDAAGVLINESTETNIWTLRVPPGDRSGLAVKIPYRLGHYFRQTMRFSARSSAEIKTGVVRPSRLVFQIGSRPDPSMPNTMRSIQTFQPDPQSGFSYVSSAVEPADITSIMGDWIGLNGVKILTQNIHGELQCAAAEERPGPLHPPMIVSHVNGLPGSLERGFLQLKVIDDSETPIGTRIDLIDVNGQRFTIIENLGRLRDEPPSQSVWLAYADFHPWVFGKTVSGSRLDPSKIREIQLRFYGLNQAPKQLRVKLDSIEFSEATD